MTLSIGSDDTSTRYDHDIDEISIICLGGWNAVNHYPITLIPGTLKLFFLLYLNTEVLHKSIDLISLKKVMFNVSIYNPHASL